MYRLFAAAIAIALAAAMTHAQAGAKKPPGCARLHLDVNAHQAFGNVELPPDHVCAPVERNGYLLPDPNCSPGAVNPSVTIQVLRNPKFRTGCIRDGATTAAAKNKTYKWYHIKKPKKNTGKSQQCELDHIISLELGGADTLDNIWPQCTFGERSLKKRAFKVKDLVENWLAKAVREGSISLEDAQKGIAEDWTQFLDRAR